MHFAFKITPFIQILIIVAFICIKAKKAKLFNVKLLKLFFISVS